MGVKTEEKFTKQELIDWVNFLYKDLLEHSVYIGGYFFNFEQLDEFLNKKSKMERKITGATNKMNINSYMLQQPLLKGCTTRLNLMNEELKKQADFVIEKIKTLNKIHEKVELSVTYEEMCHICERLGFMKDEVDQFHKFLTEEVQHVKKEDMNQFFVFINDLLSDIKQQLKEEVPIIKLKLPLNSK